MVTHCFILLMLLVGCSISNAEEAVEIPLSEVWGLNFLETKPMAELEPERYGKSGHKAPSVEEKNLHLFETLRYQLLRALNRMPRRSMKRSFAVLGEGRHALERAHAVIVNGQPAQNSFVHGEVISIVFFTRMIGHMHLTSVKRAENIITIKYCYAPLSSRQIVSAKAAIIPLGKLPPGGYQVQIVGYTKKPDDSKSDCELITDDSMRELVSKPFRFSVIEKATNKREDELKP